MKNPKNGTCIIIAGGPISDCDKVTVNVMPNDFVIACDMGYRTAQYFGIKPELVVGDFDSFQGTISPEIEVITASVKKNDTDTMLGVKIGLEKGYRNFIIIGGFGARLDHTVANLQTLCYLCEHGATGRIVANENCAWAVKDSKLTIEPMQGYHLSVFAANGTCYGVTLEQLEYPLSNYTLEPFFPLGVSNEFTNKPAKISVSSGILLIIASKENKI